MLKRTLIALTLWTSLAFGDVLTFTLSDDTGASLTSSPASSPVIGSSSVSAVQALFSTPVAIQDGLFTFVSAARSGSTLCGGFGCSQSYLSGGYWSIIGRISTGSVTIEGPGGIATTLAEGSFASAFGFNPNLFNDGARNSFSSTITVSFANPQLLALFGLSSVVASNGNSVTMARGGIYSAGSFTNVPSSILGEGSLSFEAASSAVPEPSSTLVLTGCIGVLAALRNRRAANASSIAA